MNKNMLLVGIVVLVFIGAGATYAYSSRGHEQMQAPVMEEHHMEQNGPMEGTTSDATQMMGTTSMHSGKDVPRQPEGQMMAH
jgi:hypothetical protein